MPLHTHKVRLYRRVSTDDQAKHGHSLDAQLRELTEFAMRQRWEIVGDYIDDGYSAKSMKRPALKRLLADIEPGDVVLFYKLDRLTRSVSDLDKLLTQIEQRKAMIKSMTEEFDTTTASGRMFIRVVAIIAQWERETLSERTALGMAQKAKERQWTGGKAPFGYTTSPDERGKTNRAGVPLRKLVPDETTAHVVPMIFRRYVYGDENGKRQGVRKIALWLNEKGVRGSEGGLWASNRVVKILTNPIYVGDLVFRSRHGEERGQGDHTPLVDRETFEAAQALYQRRKFEAPRQATSEYPLAGIARCGFCGGTIHGRKARKFKDYAYRCNDYHMGRPCGGDGKRLTYTNGPEVERRLMKRVASLFEGRDGLHEYIDLWRRKAKETSSVDEGELRRVRAEINEAKAAIKRWDDAYESGNIDIAKYNEKVAPHDERAKALQATLAELESKIIREPAWETLRVDGIDWERDWFELSPQHRREAIQSLCEAIQAKILLYPGNEVDFVPDLDDEPPLRTSRPETSERLSAT